MGFHGVIDKISLGLSSIFIKKKYFRDSIESESILKHIKSVNIEFLKVNGAGMYEIKVDTLVGELETGFRIAQWKGRDYPTIIYQHGVTEVPFDFSFNKIFPSKQYVNIDANLIAIKAPFHKGFKDFLENNNTLSKYVAMFAVSVQLMESLVRYARENASGKVVISGVSLGGFSTNLHHTYYNTADYYKPLLSGTKIDEALLDSAYSGMISTLAKDNPKQVKEILDFTADFKKVDNANVFPLLGKFDQVVLLDRESPIYNFENMMIIEKGHATGASAFEDLRKYILAGL